MWHQNLFRLFSEIKNKMNLKGKKRGLTKALEFDLTDKEKGMKQDEIAKKITRKKRKKKHHLINHNFPFCVLILHQAFAHHYIQTSSKVATFLLIKMGNLHYSKAETYQHNSYKYNNRFLVHHYSTQIRLSNSGIWVCRCTIKRLLPYQIMCKKSMAVENGLQIAIGSFPTTWLSGIEIAE